MNLGELRTKYAHLESQDRLLFKETFINNSYCLNEDVCRGKNVLDVGANVGFASIMFSEFGAKKVVSVEPQVDNFRRLKENIKDLENIIPLNFAAYNSLEDKVRISNNNTGSKVNDNDGDWVQTINLKQLLELSLFPLDDNDMLLKMDCEGSEYEFLIDARGDDIRRFKRIFIEIHESNDLCSFSSNPLSKISFLVDYLKFIGYKIIYIGDKMYYYSYLPDGTVNPEGIEMPVRVYLFERDADE